MKLTAVTALFALVHVSFAALTLRQVSVRPLFATCTETADCTNLDVDKLNLRCEAGSCVPSKLGEPCQNSFDCSTFTTCGAEATCARGEPGSTCTTWRQCDVGSSCIDGTCVAAEIGTGCFKSYNCGDGRTCEKLKCVAGTANKECRTGADCVSGKCRMNIVGRFATGLCSSPPPSPSPMPVAPPPSPEVAATQAEEVTAPVAAEAESAPDASGTESASSEAKDTASSTSNESAPAQSKPAETTDTMDSMTKDSEASTTPVAADQGPNSPEQPPTADAPVEDTSSGAEQPSTADAPVEDTSSGAEQPSTVVAPVEDTSSGTVSNEESSANTIVDTESMDPAFTTDGPEPSPGTSSSTEDPVVDQPSSSTTTTTQNDPICIGASSHVAGVPLNGLLKPAMRMQLHPLRLARRHQPVSMLCHESMGARLCASARHVVESDGDMMFMQDFCATRACKVAMDVPLNFKGPCGEHIEFMPGLRATQHSAVGDMTALAVSRLECTMRASNRLLWTVRTL